MRRPSLVLALLAVLVAAGVVAQQLVRAQTGPLPLVAVFEVHLLAVAAVLALAAVPGALRRDAARARLALVAVVVVVVVRLGGELWSPGPPDPVQALGPAGVGRGELVVLTWNLELGARAASGSVAGITEIDADLVALQELDPAAAAAIEADPVLRTRYPYRILEPQPGVEGMGVLAKLPLILGESRADPMLIRAGLLLPDGRRLEVVDVHPYGPGITMASGWPVGLDTRARDARLRVIREVLDGVDDRAALLVAGDLNTTPTEPAFAVVADGLADAHASVGLGPGFTWRPGSLETLGVGLLRIDHVLTGEWLTPLAVREDCSLAGDHCRVVVRLRVEPAG